MKEAQWSNEDLIVEEKIPVILLSSVESTHVHMHSPVTDETRVGENGW